ncbi:hypothetical protein ACSBR2_014247 [Camellia fascicularis]
MTQGPGFEIYTNLLIAVDQNWEVRGLPLSALVDLSSTSNLCCAFSLVPTWLGSNVLDTLFLSLLGYQSGLVSIAASTTTEWWP